MENYDTQAEHYMTRTRGVVRSMPIAVRRPLISRLFAGLIKMGDSPSKANSMDDMRPRPEKLTGRAFYESIGSPKMVLAPMVDRSEFVGSWSLISS